MIQSCGAGAVFDIACEHAREFFTSRGEITKRKRCSRPCTTGHVCLGGARLCGYRGDRVRALVLFESALRQPAPARAVACPWRHHVGVVRVVLCPNLSGRHTSPSHTPPPRDCGSDAGNSGRGLGTYATVAATAREVQAHVIRQFHFLFGFNLVNLFLFGILVDIRTCVPCAAGSSQAADVDGDADAACACRGTDCASSSTQAPLAQMAAIDLCILLFVGAETLWQRRLHPALGWSAAAVIGSLHLTMLMIMSDWWLPFVARVFA